VEHRAASVELTRHEFIVTHVAAFPHHDAISPSINPKLLKRVYFSLRVTSLKLYLRVTYTRVGRQGSEHERSDVASAATSAAIATSPRSSSPTK
jgi:hypothetical protein